jgi:hypothetical protein
MIEICSIIKFSLSQYEKSRNGSLEAVMISRSTKLLPFPRKHWETALCSLSPNIFWMLYFLADSKMDFSRQQEFPYWQGEWIFCFQWKLWSAQIYDFNNWHHGSDQPEKFYKFTYVILRKNPLITESKILSFLYESRDQCKKRLSFHVVLWSRAVFGPDDFCSKFSLSANFNAFFCHALINIVSMLVDGIWRDLGILISQTSLFGYEDHSIAY